MKSKRPNVFLSAAVILLCLVLVSAHFTAGIFAKMISGTKGEDSGRLAAFRVDAELTPAGEDGAYQLVLDNHSDVAVRCTLTVTLGKPASGTVRIGEKTVVFRDQTKVSIGDYALFLAPGERSEAIKLTVSVENAGETEEHFTDRSNDTVSGSNETVAFTVLVSCIQVD